MQRISIRFRLGTILLALCLTVVLTAQDKQQFADAQKKNQEALKQYTWKSRTELKLKGESKNVKLEQVRYDGNGKLQKTPIGGTPEAAPQQQQRERGVKGAVKGKIVENKKEEFAEEMKKLAQLVASYGHMPADKIQAFAKNATFTKGTGADERIVLVQGKDVMQSGDSVSLKIDAATMMMKSVEIQTALDKKPVKATSEFMSVAGGPTYQAKSVVLYPEKQLELTVDNYDYQRVGQ